MIYFIDESGNSGDLTLTGIESNFNNQEFFTLACIGVKENDIDKLNIKINELKQKYKIQAKDLKLRSIYDKKIKFLLEVFNYLEEINANILIEVVDKKYMIATNIVNCLLYPPYFTKQNNENQQLKIIMASHLLNYLPNQFFNKFSEITLTPSKDGLLELFNELKVWLSNHNNEVSTAIIPHLEESLDDFQLMDKNKNLDRPSFSYFLPLPDKNKRNELVGILPDINCFTNIHARLNMVHNNLDNHTIIYDDQEHFNNILTEYHKNSINNNFENLNTNPNSDFNFAKSTELKFGNSKNIIGIQIADLFAGFSSKLIYEIIHNNYDTNTDIKLNILDKIQKTNIKLKGLGINIVSSFERQEKVFRTIQR